MNKETEDNLNNTRRQPSANINMMKTVNDGEVNNVKLTFKTTPQTNMSVRKTSVSDKILKFQELSQPNECVIGSSRCATHNEKLVRVIKNVRRSKPS